MPELPEVETIRRGLSKTITDKKIVNFDDRDSKVVQIKKEDIVGAKVESVERRAKIIIISMNNNKSMIFHMKMTGQLIWENCAGGKDFCLRNRKGAGPAQSLAQRAGGGPARNAQQRVAGGHPDKAWLEKLPNKHTRAIFTFDDQSVLYFNDIRRFGWVKIFQTKELKNPSTSLRTGSGTKELKNIGVEPLSKDLTVQYLKQMAKRFSGRKIKQFIMDQAIIAGVGNIYADEALYEAKILPTRLAKDLKTAEWQKLICAIKKVLEKGIAHGGSSAENFVDAYGEQGRAQEYLMVYKKTGQKCNNRCGGTIKRMVIGGRSTHFCPKCQR